MIVFLVPDVSPIQLQHLLELLQKHGLHGFQTEFDGRTVVLTTEIRSGYCANVPELQAALSDIPGIEKIVRVAEPYPLVARKVREERSRVQTGSLSLGNGTFGIIAGPCTVETEGQTLLTALAVKKAGAHALRGGAFKPRSSPYAFQGLKEQGLKILAKAREETGLAIVTEAMSPEEVPLVAEYADVVQIGTRNAQNYRLLQAVGKIRKPVLLKRGFGCSLEEFLMSAEYILAGGNQQVILCERGIRTFESFTRFTLPLAVVPELRTKTHLPILVDPSHATGNGDFVIPMSAAATAVGADGLLIEVHPEPNAALCDGRQSLTFEEFERLVRTCEQIFPIARKEFAE